MGIEGAEVEMLRGSLDRLWELRARAIEFHRDNRKAIDFDATLRAFGFAVSDYGSALAVVRG